MHPQVLQIIKLCKLLGFKIIHIISNGRKYADEKFLLALIKNGVNRFSVSIHSHDSTVEDYLTQRPGGFQEKIQGLKNLNKFYQKSLISNPVSINIVINKLNYKDIVQTLRFLNKLGIKDFRLNFIWLHGRANKYNELFLKYSDFLPYIDKIIKLVEQKGITLAFEGIPPCLIKNQQRLSYLGELRDKKTEIIAYNNPNKSRERFNWQERKKNEFKVKHENCNACQWNEICDGVWQDYIKIYGWQEFNF